MGSCWETVSVGRGRHRFSRVTAIADGSRPVSGSRTERVSGCSIPPTCAHDTMSKRQKDGGAYLSSDIRTRWREEREEQKTRAQGPSVGAPRQKWATKGWWVVIGLDGLGLGGRPIWPQTAVLVSPPTPPSSCRPSHFTSKTPFPCLLLRHRDTGTARTPAQP